ncbi:hypothetical protein ACKWTF_000090 [Chironomus riparius]
MKENLNLNSTEREAKLFILNVLLKGLQLSEPCDESFNEQVFKIPDFFDEAKFKRGQKYFAENRFGILLSNLCGLFSLICEPNGAKFLDNTNYSSTASLARKRYVRTILHVLLWCTEELSYESRSWKSPKKVRKMHLSASNASLIKGGLGISQMFMSFTTFGFMGYALIKPQLLGIKYDSKEDREAYVHMWAVITSMLGIKDEYNMCLHKFVVVEMICHIQIRYFFNPLLQMETKIFQKLGQALCDGLKYHIPFLSYKYCLFLTRRLAGIPGYQFDVDLSKEFLIRQIFTKSELEIIKAKYQNFKGFENYKGLIFAEKMHIIDIKRNPEVIFETDDQKRIIINLLELEYPDKLELIEYNDENYKSFLNDKKFDTLKKSDRCLVKLMIQSLNSSKYFITKYIAELSLSAFLKVMKTCESNYTNFN